MFLLYSIDIVDQFKNACKSLNVIQVEVIRKAMEDIIEKAKSNGNF